MNAAAAEVFRPNVLGQVYDDDDPGMRPKVLIPASTNRPDLTHTTADIQGAQPHPKDVCHRPRDTNPLCPQYRLATGRSVWVAEERGCPEPKVGSEPGADSRTESRADL